MSTFHHLDHTHAPELARKAQAHSAPHFARAKPDDLLGQYGPGFVGWRDLDNLAIRVAHECSFFPRWQSVRLFHTRSGRLGVHAWDNGLTGYTLIAMPMDGRLRCLVLGDGSTSEVRTFPMDAHPYEVYNELTNLDRDLWRGDLPRALEPMTYDDVAFDHRTPGAPLAPDSGDLWHYELGWAHALRKQLALGLGKDMVPLFAHAGRATPGSFEHLNHVPGTPDKGTRGNVG